jgi:hypothetical protein
VGLTPARELLADEPKAFGVIHRHDRTRNDPRPSRFDLLDRAAHQAEEAILFRGLRNAPVRLAGPPRSRIGSCSFHVITLRRFPTMRGQKGHVDVAVPQRTLGSSDAATILLETLLSPHHRGSPSTARKLFIRHVGYYQVDPSVPSSSGEVPQQPPLKTQARRGFPKVV